MKHWTINIFLFIVLIVALWSVGYLVFGIYIGEKECPIRIVDKIVFQTVTSTPDLIEYPACPPTTCKEINEIVDIQYRDNPETQELLTICQMENAECITGLRDYETCKVDRAYLRNEVMRK